MLERGGAVVCMVQKAVVAGPTAETGVSACVPSLRRSSGGSSELVR